MRAFAVIALCAAAISACSSTSDGSAVEARDACFALAKAADDVSLTTSAMRVELQQDTTGLVIFNWPAAQHGADYVCTVKAANREITKFTKNGMPLLNEVSEDLRTF